MYFVTLSCKTSQKKESGKKRKQSEGNESGGTKTDGNKKGKIVKTTELACRFCEKSYKKKGKDLSNHEESCLKNPTRVPWVACLHMCGKSFPPNGLANHQKQCVNNQNKTKRKKSQNQKNKEMVSK